MEQLKKTIRMNKEGKVVTDQFYVDGDIHVPDAKGDVGRIVYSDGKLKLEDMKIVENYIRVSGKIIYQILYMEEGSEHRMSSVQGKLPFEEMVYSDEAADLVYLKEEHTELSVSVIHGRKMNVKAMVEMELGTTLVTEDALTIDLEEEPGLYKKLEETELLELFVSKKDTFRIKEELRIPNTREPVGTILLSKVEPGKLEARLASGELLLRGELLLFVMYATVEGGTDWTEQTVSYEGRIPFSGAEDTMYHHLRTRLSDETIDLRMDEDGEMRIIGVEANVEVMACIYEEYQISYLKDAYSLRKELKAEREKKRMRRLLMQKQSQYKLEEKVPVPELGEALLQTCHVGGELKLTHTEKVADGILTEGVLYVSVLYVNANDDSPFEVWKGMVPFTNVVNCSGMEASSEYELDGRLSRLRIGMFGNGMIEVSASIDYTIFLTEPVEIDSIQKIEELLYDREQQESAAGIIGYIVREGDDLWSLAKQYHTTMERIREVNELDTELLKTGAKLLIFKENMGIL